MFAGDEVVVTCCPRSRGARLRSGAAELARSVDPTASAGAVVKVYAAYASPFWRASGPNGQAASDTGPVKVTFDNSPPSGTRACLGFLEGDEARIWCRRPLDERRDAVLGSFARYFWPPGPRPLSRRAERDRLQRSSVAAAMARPHDRRVDGIRTRARDPDRTDPLPCRGRVLAGGNGYMEGAVRSGGGGRPHPPRPPPTAPPQSESAAEVPAEHHLTVLVDGGVPGNATG